MLQAYHTDVTGVLRVYYHALEDVSELVCLRMCTMSAVTGTHCTVLKAMH